MHLGKAVRQVKILDMWEYVKNGENNHKGKTVQMIHPKKAKGRQVVMQILVEKKIGRVS